MTFKLNDEVSISQAKTGGWGIISGRKNSIYKGFEETKNLAYKQNRKSLM